MIDCSNVPFEELAGKEWIVTNGIGGYASSSITGANTRRYHGLLVASFNPPTERMVILSKVEETIYHDGKDLYFHSNEYDQKVHPEGFRHQVSFNRKPLPVFEFKHQQVALQKTIFMVYGSNTTVLTYKNTGSVKYLLKLTPQYVHRDYHSLWHEQPNYDFLIKQKNDVQEIFAYYGAHPLYFSFKGMRFVENRYWNRKVLYRIDKERGQGYLEDLYSAGHVEKEIGPGEEVHLIFSLDKAMLVPDPVEFRRNELERLETLVPAEISNPFLKDLLISGDQFIVHRRTTDNFSVIAGYHWFTDWGRDSMIAIRGLCIAAGRPGIARSVISTFLTYLKKGIIPNRFPDYQGDMAEYNTVDATLWLFVALYEYDKKYHDNEFLLEVEPSLFEIISQHLAGTLHNIKATDHGLLSQGEKGFQLTWMDARINDVVFTPRQGCPVEVNALWYNALKVYEHVCDRINKQPDNRIANTIACFEKHFTVHFKSPEGHLYDVITHSGQPDNSIRPNQIFAVSLPFSPLQEKEAKSVVESVKKYLLTDYGLRTLDPRHPDFCPHYGGDIWSRDGAYHQGTVWPFLLPEYLMAYLKVNNDSTEARAIVKDHLLPLKEHFYNNECIHGISEIFDGLEPSTGKGCAQQTWSVSNLAMLLLKTGIEL